MTHALPPLAPTRRPVVGWFVWAMGWVAAVLLLLAVIALTNGPIRNWVEELAPPATGSLGDGVISVAITGGLMAGFASAAFFLTRFIRAVGLRLRTWHAEQTLARDPRRPVLYLRAFADDERTFSTSESFESSLASVLGEVGPVIAVGRPGERLPPQGGARLYLSEESWQPTVRDLMTRAALTVLSAGTSPGVLWELARAVELVQPTRFLIAVPQTLRSDDAEKWKSFCALAAEAMPHPLPARLDGATFISFDSDWKPFVVVPPPKSKSNPLAPRAGIRSLLRPFCERSGFELRRRSLSDMPWEMLLVLVVVVQVGSLTRLPSALRWRELSAFEGVTISMPGKYYEKRMTTEIRPGVQLNSHEYGVLRHDRSLEFALAVGDYTNVDLTRDPGAVLQGMRDALVQQLSGKLVNDSSVQVGPNAGREWRIDVPDRQLVVRARMFVAGPGRTILSSVFMPANGSEDDAAQQFLDSLQAR